MTDKTKKNDGPSCACGKVDLYDEMLKNQKKEEAKKDEDESSNSETTEKPE